MTPLIPIAAAIPILEQRASWLLKRMTEAEQAGRVLAFDRQEYLALEAALEALRKATS